MPVAIPVIAGAVVGAGAVALGATLTAAVVVGSLVATGLSMLSTPSMKGVPAPQLPTSYKVDPTRLTFQGDAPRRIVYGRPRVSGVVVYANVAGGDHEHLFMVVAIAAHRVAEVEEIYLDGKASTEYGHNLQWWWKDGSTDQAADTTLVNTFPEWTANHRLRGIAYAVVRMTHDREVFKSGMPRNIQFDVKGKPVYDPRTGQTSWSSNPALNLADYLTSTDGLGIPYSEIDEGHLIASANVCDQVPDNYVSSLCEGRYSCNGVLELSQSRSNIIELLVGSMAGALIWSESKFFIFAGAPLEPVASITEDQIAGNMTVTPSSSIDQTFNTIKGTFLDGFSDYVFNDFPPVTAQAYLDQDGEVLVRDIQLPLTISSLTAQRLGTIFLRRERLGETVVLECDWSVFNLTVWDVVYVSIEPLGWEKRQFQITRWSFRLPKENDPGGVTLELREYHPDIYSDDISLTPETGAGTIIAPDVTLISPPLWVNAESGLPQADPHTFTPRIKVSWAKSLNPYAIGYEVALVQEGEDVMDWVPIPDVNTTELLLPAELGRSYVATVRALNSFGKKSGEASFGPVVADSGAAIPPARPKGFTYTANGRWIALSWAASSGAVRYLVYAVKQNEEPALVAEVAAPSTTVTTLHQAHETTYRVVAVSASGGASPGAELVVPRRVAGILVSAEKLANMEIVTGFVPYKNSVLVPQSDTLASDLGWEVFEEIVPDQVEESFAWSYARSHTGLTYPEGVIAATLKGAPITVPPLGFDGSERYDDEWELGGFARVGFRVTVAQGPIVIRRFDIYLEI